MAQASHFDGAATKVDAAATVIMSRHSQEQSTEGERPRGTSTTTSSRLEDDIDDNPHSHFLSPVHMYESWDDSDDDSDDGVEFDAGITDFALFQDDYKRAKDQGLPLSDKWNDFVEDQSECLDRAVARTRAERASRPAGPFYSGSSFAQSEAVPSLTPDTSPRLADDLDYDSSEDTDPRPYRTEIVTPDVKVSSPINIPRRSSKILGTLSESAIEDGDFEDPAAPAFLLYRHNQRTEQRRQPSKPQLQLPPMRPGLSAGRRTLSGKLHVWKRPSWELYSVWEEKEEEAAQDEARERVKDGTLRKKKGKEELRRSISDY